MAYVLQAVIAPVALLRGVADPTADMHVVELNQGLALLPLTERFHDRVAMADGDRLGCDFLPGGFGDTLAVWSAQGPVVYVEADYFGGVGSQSAAAWRDGRLGFGPVHLGVDESFPPEGTPISRALRHVGATADGFHDEFDAVGLARHRGIEGWLAEIGVRQPAD